MKVESICHVWQAYVAGPLERTDLQTWFGIHELLMRRCTLKAGRKPAFAVAELDAITGLGTAVLRASIRRLQRFGFLSWSEHRIALMDGSETILTGLTGLSTMLAEVTNARRTVPVPRHTILLLAETRRPVVLATLLGHLLRGMYYRGGECVAWGTCKSSWIATTFGVDVRNVKAARGELEQLGWMRRIESRHWHRQRYGGSFVISLGWSTRISPPRKCRSVPKSPPPESDKYLPSELNHQKRPAVRVTGVQGQHTKRREPRLVHVVATDLADGRRLAELFREAAKMGLVKNTSAERLQFFAAAERAKRLGSRNPSGFFATLVQQRLWGHLSQCDEDAARRTLGRMPEFFHAERPEPVAKPFRLARPSRTPTPEETLLVRELVLRSLASVPPGPASFLSSDS